MPARLSPSAILRGLCPRCRQASVLKGVFRLHRRCPGCDLDLYPESGFYIGAMAVSYVTTAVLTAPPMIALKLLGAPLEVLIVFPFVEFLFVGTLLLFYSRILWLHLEYAATRRMDG